MSDNRSVIVLVGWLDWIKMKRVLERIYEGFRAMQTGITNWLFVIGVVIVAVYLAPLLIGLIASGILQLLIGVIVVYCIVQVALNTAPNFDKYR